MVDMSPAALTERLRLMGELCDKMLNEKNDAGESANAELETEIVEGDEDADQSRER